MLRNAFKRTPRCSASDAFKSVALVFANKFYQHYIQTCSGDKKTYLNPFIKRANNMHEKNQEIIVLDANHRKSLISFHKRQGLKMSLKSKPVFLPSIKSERKLPAGNEELARTQIQSKRKKFVIFAKNKRYQP